MPAQPDLIIWGSRIRTLDPNLPTCSAVAVKDGRFAATGDADTIRAMRGPGTTVVDGRGHRMLLLERLVGWFKGHPGTRFSTLGAAAEAFRVGQPRVTIN